MEKRWAQAPGRREQLALYCESLDDVVAAGHPIRVLDACLDMLDWAAWESRYAGHRGQPPIHPRLMAGSILYGLMRGIRSSRGLEDATRERVDFMWFLERRTIDHSTFAEFRVLFGKELKALNRQIAKRVCEQHADALLSLIIDGTRIRANSDRHGARTAQSLERLIGLCVQELDKKLAVLADTDQRNECATEEIQRLHKEIDMLRGQVARYKRVLDVAHSRDARKQEMEGAKAQAVRVPVTDPDSQIMPNKEGGYAPNFTPTVAVDPVSRVIVLGEVQVGSEENAAVMPAVEAAQVLGGTALKNVVADTGFASGETLQALETKYIEAYMPTGADFSERNPANRPDPSQPVAQSQWDTLPKRNGKLSPAAFIYDEENNRYYCPLGKLLVRKRSGKYCRTGISYTQYECPGKDGCPLAAQCVQEKAAARILTRDQYQPIRDLVGHRMATPLGRARYKTRAPVVEGVFAQIKHGMGIRRFLLRGLEKVRTEWTWVCTAFNLRLLLGLLMPSDGSPIRKRVPRKAKTSQQEQNQRLVQTFMEL